MDGRDAREQRGQAIAKTLRVRRTPNGGYIVPSQRGEGKYAVMVGEQPRCSCPDFESRGEPCKHIFAVRVIVQREFRVRWRDRH